MSPLRLHTKTTLLVSAITLAMLLAVLLVVSARMVDLVSEGEKELARLQALSVAEQISMMPTPRDQDDLDRAVSQARGSRPNMIAVRVWEKSGEGLIERAASTDGSPVEEIPEEVKAMSRGAAGFGKIAALRDYTLQKQTGMHYRVFAPITERGGQLVKQALSFARGMEGDRVRVDLKPALREVIGMLKETFPKSIKIKYVMVEPTCAALVNPTQLSQVLMNLCVNARDAMPQGGEKVWVSSGVKSTRLPLTTSIRRRIRSLPPGQSVVTIL